MSDQGETALRPDPAAFGRSIPPGLGINLLVADVARSARFQAATAAFSWPVRTRQSASRAEKWTSVPVSSTRR